MASGEKWGTILSNLLRMAQNPLPDGPRAAAFLYQLPAPLAEGDPQGHELSLISEMSFPYNQVRPYAPGMFEKWKDVLG